MLVPIWAANLAAEFWQAARLQVAFPRDLRRAARRATVLDVIDIDRLDIVQMCDWLGANNVVCELDMSNRRLHAALVVRAQSAFVFVDARDGEQEQRFSLAHEIAHFLRDYWMPRRRLQQRLGAEAATNVFEGRRAAQPEERFHALLGRIELGFDIHLLERGEHRPHSPRLAQAEADADRLAYELLAPAEHVAGRVSGTPTAVELAIVLREEYGLPEEQALRYAGLLLPAPPPTAPFLTDLGAILRKSTREIENG